MLGLLNHEKQPGSDVEQTVRNCWVEGKSGDNFCTDPCVGLSVCLSAATWPHMDLCMSIFRGHMPHPSVSSHEPKAQARFLTEWHHPRLCSAHGQARGYSDDTFGSREAPV